MNNLIQCIANFKVRMEYNNKDFNADRVKLYEEVRKAMARLYNDNPSYFGPVVARISSAEETKIDNDLIKRGYTRIQDKIKSIRQEFSNAVTSGRSSGSGKILAEPLSFGQSTNEINTSM